jgi:LysM repeat protein
MGFWNRVKDVLISGPTQAAENVREDKREEETGKVDEPRVDVPTVEEPNVAAQKDDVPEIPVPDAGAPAEPEYRTYTVKSGDTLSEIAASYGVNWHEMAELNQLENPDLIYPGQVFKVPNS